MMRILLVSALLIYSAALVSCATDESSMSDDDVASGAEQADNPDADSDATVAADKDAAANPPDDSLEEPDKGPVDELADNTTGNKDEQSLEDELDKSDSSLEPDVSKEPDSQATNQSPIESENLTPAPVPEVPATPAVEKVRITNIRYLSNQAGGTVVVEATGPLAYHAHAQGSEFVIEVDNADIPNQLKHPYPLHDFSGAFTDLNAEQAGEQAKITVTLKANSAGAPIVQTEGNSLLIVPSSTAAPTETAQVTPGAPPAASAASEPSEPLAAKSLDEFLTGNQHFFGKPLSIQTKDADVRDVINFIAEDSGANIIMSDEVKGKVSLKIRKIPWDQALVMIMRTKKLGYVRQGNVLRITSMSELQSESDEALKMIETQKNLSPVIVKVIPINYASVLDLIKQVTPFLSKDVGKAVGDERSGTLLVTDREQVIDKVLRIVKSLDIQPNMVMIEGKIVEATETFTSYVGVNWGLGGVPTTLSNSGGFQGTPIQLTPAIGSNPVDPTAAGALFTGSLSVGALDVLGNLTASLGLAETDGVAKVLSSPRIATMNREKAEITQETQQITLQTIIDPIAHTQKTTPVTTPVTLALTVTPQITADASVIMEMEVKRQFVGAVVDETSKAAPINTRTAHTKILVHNGQTAVIGGIYQNDEQQGDSGVPGLMDMPVIGWLFKARQKSKTKNELLIFLTPKIIQQTPSQEQANIAG